MQRNKKSLLALLSIVVVLTVTFVFVIYAVISYQTQRSHMISEISGQATESANRLSRIVAPLISSYEINEYEKLLHSEINTKNHYALGAIIVDNYLMAKIVGEQVYTHGLLKGPAGDVVDYMPSSEVHNQELASAFSSASNQMFNSQGDLIGSVTVYVNDRLLDQQLQKVFQRTFFSTLILITVLASLLVLLIKRFLLSPLATMAQVMSVRDSHGIPLTRLPLTDYQELNALTVTINDMLHVISDARNNLKNEQERLSHVINGTRAGTWSWNIQTGETHFNEQWANMLGYQLQELEPVSINTWLQLVHPDDLKTSERQLNDYFAGKLDYYECEARVKHKNGEWVWILDRGKVAKWTDTGEPLEMYGTHQDITVDKRNKEQLALAANVYKEVNEGIVITDVNAIILDVNEAFTRITGFSKGEVIGQKSSILSSGRHDTEFYASLWQSLLTQGYWSGEIWNRRKNGDVYPQLMSISAVQDSPSMAAHFVALFSDISSIKEYEQRLEKMAHYDLLTGLPNRFLLSDRLRMAMSRAKRSGEILALLFLDLDGFKEVNDTYGHDMGDRLLVLLSGAMASVLREEDTLARMGGDEFVMVLPGLANQESVVPVLQRLSAAIVNPVVVSDIELMVSASIGVALYPLAEEVDADQLIRQADQAMYQAKLLGKNRYHFFDQVRDQSLRHKNSQIARLEVALRDEEFELYYQPQVNLTTQELVGFEALIRWNHPQEGVIAPGMFLPAIEHHYLMVKIGEWTIAQALMQLQAWSGQGINLPISINLSAIHLQQNDFMDRLHQLLDQYPKVDPKLLHFEVLETSALENIVQVQSIISGCQTLGIPFALDDFGTGYSTLESLKQLPVTTLKIDKSFVQNVHSDPNNLLILEAVMGLAKAFKKQVIAEGLEDLSNAELLLSYGCELAQGYAIAKPMPAVDVLRWKALR